MLMATATEDEIVKLYATLKGETFQGTYVDVWASNYSKEPQQRDVIETAPLGPRLQARLSTIHERLEGQVWKGFVPSGLGGGWKFYVTLDGILKPEIGHSGKCTIASCEVFPITEQRHQYASHMGVSITITME